MHNCLIDAKALKKYFPIRRSLMEILRGNPREYIRAVDSVDIRIDKGDIFALVGESGCGKTTTGRMLAMIEKPTQGVIWLTGHRLDKLGSKERKSLRRRIQMIYQDPYSSLNPRLTVSEIIREPLEVNRLRISHERVTNFLSLVGFRPPEKSLHKYPHELSGGQRQRVAIARAMILDPELVVADEPVSMLDVSVRSEILNLIDDLNKRLSTAFFLITHDLAVAAQISKKIAVMYLGRIVESGPTQDVIIKPEHPYTQALLSVVPRLSSTKRTKLLLKGDIPSAKNIPAGCRFHTRCAYAQEMCTNKEPELRSLRTVSVACHFAGELCAKEKPDFYGASS